MFPEAVRTAVAAKDAVVQQELPHLFEQALIER